MRTHPAPNTPDMKRTVVIAQPAYLPWLGYFELMRQADVFVFLDSVQFARQSWQCRNRIRGADGKPLWLSVSLIHQPHGTLIRDIVLPPDQSVWTTKHLRLLTERLGHAPHFEAVHAALAPIYRAPPPLLADLTIAIVRTLAARLGLAPQFLRSSLLPVGGAKADLVLNLLRHLGTTDYYSAAGSAVYLDAAREQFVSAQIECRYQTWEHPRYEQGGGEFVSHLAIVDALSWIGFDRVAELLHAGATQELQAV